MSAWKSSKHGLRSSDKKSFDDSELYAVSCGRGLKHDSNDFEARRSDSWTADDEESRQPAKVSYSLLEQRDWCQAP